MTYRRQKKRSAYQTRIPHVKGQNPRDCRFCGNLRDHGGDTGFHCAFGDKKDAAECDRFSEVE